MAKNAYVIEKNHLRQPREVGLKYSIKILSCKKAQFCHRMSKRFFHIKTLLLLLKNKGSISAELRFLNLSQKEILVYSCLGIHFPWYYFNSTLINNFLKLKDQEVQMFSYSYVVALFCIRLTSYLLFSMTAKYESIASYYYPQKYTFCKTLSALS